jgi:glycosyltransferase involved in cell wall biosynthesis
MAGADGGADVKVLLVHYNPGYGGGAESALHDHRVALERRGHQAACVYTHPQQAYAAWRPDVVHFHTVHIGLGLGVVEWAQREQIPHVLSLHDYWPFCADRMLMRHGAHPGAPDAPCSAVDGVCDGQCASRPSGLAPVVNGSPTVVFSEYAAAIYRRNGIRVDFIAPHGVDADLFHPAEEPVADLRAVTMSAYPAWNTKGMHVLRKAALAARLPVHLITGLARADVPGVLRRYSAFAFPSTYQETWGLCLTEAMATGLACVASAVAGPLDQIEDGVNGLLVPPRDAAALAGALGRLRDPALRARLGAAARATVEAQFTLGHLGERLEAIYEQL